LKKEGAWGFEKIIEDPLQPVFKNFQSMTEINQIKED
jgi:hypothetical protein